MSDLISRQDAIDVVRNYYDPEDYSTESIEDRIKRLPSAQPEPSEVARDIATIIENEKDIRVIASEPRWIPVSERLPDQIYWDAQFLVSLAWGGIGVMEYKSTGFHNYSSFSPVPIETVVAWMPLPSPYKGEQE